MKINVVGAVYNKSNEVKYVLDAFIKQSLSKEDFMLIIVDDKSTDNTVNIIESYMNKLNIKLIKNDNNLGQGVSRNIGLQYINSDIVCIQDFDCIPNYEYLEEHYNLHNKSDCDVVIGYMNLETSYFNNSNIDEIMEIVNKNKNSNEFNKMQDTVKLDSFLNCVTRNFSIKSNFITIPFFDESFSYKNDLSTGFGWEDLEMGYRLYKRNLRIVFSDKAFTIHKSHKSIINDVIKSSCSMKNFVKLLDKHPDISIVAKEWTCDIYYKILEWINRGIYKDNKEEISNNVLNSGKSIYLLSSEELLPILVSKNMNNFDNFIIDNYSKVAYYYYKILGLNFVLYDKIKDKDINIVVKDIKDISYSKILEKKTIESKSVSKRLKILTYRWHCAHQYELWKLPHDFYLIDGPGSMGWDYNQRPLRDNSRYIKYNKLEDINFNDYDLMIFHFDENVLCPELSNGILDKNWGYIFKELFNKCNIPKIALCHGTPPFYGQFKFDYKRKDLLMKPIEKEIQKYKDFLGDTLVITNSNKCREEWGFNNSKTIWHGFDPADYPSLIDPQRDIIYIANSVRHRPWYRGYDLWKEVVDGIENDYLGARNEDKEKYYSFVSNFPKVKEPEKFVNMNDYARIKFSNYVDLLRNYKIFFNATLRSPMPRSRAEAMLCGSTIVTTNYHDEDMWIENEVDGFYSNDPKQLREYLEYSLKNEDECYRIGQKGRKKAMEVFNQDRYLREWKEVINSLI